MRPAAVQGIQPKVKSNGARLKAIQLNLKKTDATIYAACSPAR